MKKCTIFLLFLLFLAGCTPQEASNDLSDHSTVYMSASTSYEVATVQEEAVDLLLGVQGYAVGDGEYEENNFYTAVISDFQKTQQQISIQTTVYPEDDTVLLLELAAGDGPDLILTGSFDNAGILTGTGALVDLYSWLDADAELSRASFLNLSLLEIDRKLTRVSPQYYISTYYGTQDAYGTEMGWNLDACLARITNASCPQDILGNITGRSFIASMIAPYAAQHVNYEEATCDFDTEEFRTILEIASAIRMNTDEPNVYTENTQTTQEFFSTYPEVIYPCRIAGVSEYTTFLNTTAGIHVNFMGMPCQEGNGAQAAFLQPLSVCSFTEHPDECWRFVKYFLTNDSILEDTSYFPVYLPHLEQQIQEALVDSIDRKQDNPQSLFAIAALGEEVTPQFTEEEAMLLKYLLYEAPMLYGYDPVISPVVLEETTDFLSGSKSADQVISIIENRISIYLSEIQQAP